MRELVGPVHFQLQHDLDYIPFIEYDLSKPDMTWSTIPFKFFKVEPAPPNKIALKKVFLLN